MSKQFWVFLAVGLGVVGLVLAFVWFGSKGAHLELNGNILKVRVLAVGEKASLVVADFRISNPSGVQFIVSDLRLHLTPGTGDPVEGVPASRGDVDRVFQAQKLIGPHFNNVLTLRDTISPHQTMDRMTAARFELPESAINQRKGISLRIEDVDGTVAEITEKP